MSLFGGMLLLVLLITLGYFLYYDYTSYNRKPWYIYHCKQCGKITRHDSMTERCLKCGEDDSHGQST